MSKINGTMIRVSCDGKLIARDFYCDYSRKNKNTYKIVSKAFLTTDKGHPFMTGNENIMNNKGLKEWYNRLGDKDKLLDINVYYEGNEKESLLSIAGYLYSVKVIAKVEEAVIIHLKFKNI